MEAIRHILAIDLKSFYASVECLDRGLDPFTTPLAVVDDERGDNTIVLAVSPFLKARGVPSRCRKKDLPTDIPDMIYASPRMNRYLEMSSKVTGIYLDYVDKANIHVYSIDESFLDVTDFLQYQGMTDVEYAKTIVKDVKKRTGLTVCAGVGDNVFMAKVAMDIGAKHAKDFVAKWTKADIREKLWPITPLSKMWGIGSRLEKRLNAMGFHCVGDVACASRTHIRRTLGVVGDEIWLHANGIDDARISEKRTDPQKSMTVAQQLFFSANREDIRRLTLEMAEELSARLRKAHVGCMELAVWHADKDGYGGMEHSLSLAPWVTSTELAEEASRLLDRLPMDASATAVGIVAQGLTPLAMVQQSLFVDDEKRERDRRFDKTVDAVRARFGKDSLLRVSSLLKRSTSLRRSHQIGGHKA